MKLFNGKNGRALVASLGLLVAAGVANADTETGTIEIITVASELSADPGGFAIRMTTPETLGTGRCNNDGMINVVFSGESSKAMLTSLVAANNNGRSVTVNYVIEDDVCNLGYATVH